MLKRTLTLATVLVFSLSMGCSTVQKWMAGGAVVGGAIGGVVGAHQGEAGAGVLIGALTGATAGGLVGSILEYKEIQRLEAEIASLKDELNKTKAELEAAKKRIAELEAELAALREKLKNARFAEAEISVPADVLFRPGSARLTKEGREALDKAGQTIMSQYKDKFVMIEGHTDSDPIKASGWKSNWELGSARSLAVLHYLNSKGVDAALLSAATFSKYHPVAGNDTKEGKAKNRRAVLVVYSNWPKATVQ